LPTCFCTHYPEVDADGFITHFAPASSSKSSQLLQHSTAAAAGLTVVPSGSFVLPTFCDLHLHAPQFLYQGTGLDLPLMQWLDEYAYRSEERLDGDPSLAQRVYTRLARRLLENGTGAVLLFGTIKTETKYAIVYLSSRGSLKQSAYSLILAKAMHAAGLRAFVGKLSMDISSRPTYVEPSASAALAAAQTFIRSCRELSAHLPANRRLVQPVLTPRFVPTCSDALLESLGKVSEEEDVRVQSHMSEAHDQVAWVEQERGVSDVQVFTRVRPVQIP
jgi:guanine deaminase